LHHEAHEEHEGEAVSRQEARYWTAFRLLKVLYREAHEEHEERHEMNIAVDILKKMNDLKA
jgi:hypothetical protein